jgi:hypothetical protein
MREFMKKNWLVLAIALGGLSIYGYEKYQTHQRSQYWKARLANSKAEPTTTEASAEPVLSDGMTAECKRQARLDSSRELEAKFLADREQLAKMGVLTVVTPTSGPLGAKHRLVGERPPAVNYPAVSGDILAQLGVTLENQYEGEYGITDEVIRGLADQAYRKTGIADEALRGWTLSVRASDSGIKYTSLEADKKLGVIALNPPDFERIATHELSHFLAGDSFVNNEAIVGVAKEYVAIAAEVLDPAKEFRDLWSYNFQNRPIFGLARNINGQSGMIHAAGAPLDGWRYDLLRTTDEVIGEDGQVKLAQAIYQTATEQGSLSLEDMERLFVEAGITNCAIFQKTLEPGLYLDLLFMKNGTAVVLAKTIDSDGYEGITSTPEQIIWRNSEGEAIGGTDTQPLQSALMFADSAPLVHAAAQLEVRVGGEPYTFELQNTVASGTTKTTSPSTTSFR